MYGKLKNSQKNNTLFLIFIIGLFLLFFTSCSGSGSSSGSNTGTSSNISGVVQKGRFLDGEITVQALNDKGSLYGSITRADITNEGTYGLKLGSTGLYLLTAKGRFFNEFTGKNSTEEVELYALVNLSNKKVSEQININLFTSLEYNRVIVLMQGGKSYADALASTKYSMKILFGLAENINASELDIYDLNGTLKEENKNLLLFSATLLKVLDKSHPIEKISGKLNNIQKFSLNTMDNLYRDFGDNGVIDGLAQDTYEDMVVDDEDDTWDTVTENLELGEVEAPEDDWVEIGASGTTLTISEFSLQSARLNGVLKDYESETVFYTGLPTDELRLNFTLKSTTKTPTAYTAEVFAIAEGKTPLLVKSGISVTERSIVSMGVEIEVTASLKNFFKEAYRSGKNVKFRVITDVVSNVITHLTVSKISDVLPKFVGLSNKLKVNTTLVDIRTAQYGKKLDSSCNEIVGSFDDSMIQYAQFDMGINWRPSAAWNDVNGSVVHACMELRYNSTDNSYDSTLKSSEIRFPNNTALVRTSFDSWLFSILDAGSREIHINADGDFVGDSMITLFSLPPSVTMHYEALENGNLLPISPEAQRYFLVSLSHPNISDDWDDISIVLKKEFDENNSLTPYFHAKGLPFYMNLDNAELRFNSEGLKFTNVSARYIHNGDRSKLTSNDIQFAHSTGTFNVTINDNGLQTNTPIHFEAVSNAKIHFPYSSMTQNGFDLNIVNGEIVPFNGDMVGNYTLGYSSECKDKSCSEEGSSSQTKYTFASTNRYTGKDGAFMSAVNIDNKKIAWGSQKNSQYVFERDNDTQGVMYVPGFTLTANTPQALISTLLGSRDLDSTGRLSNLHSLKSPFTKKGNGLFAGLNVGSLYLTNDEVDSLTSLAGTNMNVKVGNTESVTLSSNSKSKYYIRPSGITGVFNGSLDEANEDLDIYGYSMTFKRFAFSQVANKLNTKTLIDGAIKVEGDGDFKVDFASLGLDCTGALNGGLVEESDCNASPKINCEQRLAKWKTNTKFVSVDFEENAEEVCSDKTLKIAHVLDVRALSNPLGLTTNWTTAGKPENAIVSGSSSNFLDRNEQNDESQGFSVTLDSGSELTNEGWYKFSGAFGLPFWGMQAVDLGLTNKSILERTKTRVMPRNLLTSTTYSTNKPQEFNAEYEWGSTGFGFTLPVVYNAKESDEESIFIGKKLEIDLGVMNANAGINYIKPKDTKISFGASADFEAMGKLQIKIDLNDPESIHSIDDTLETFGIGGDPIYHTIGLILDPLHEAEVYADKGLLLGMEELGVMALEQGAEESGVDPFEGVAEVMSEIHALPIKVVNMTEDYVYEKIDSKLSAAVQLLSVGLNETGDVVNEDIENSVNQIQVLLKSAKSGFNELDRLKAQLRDINETLDEVDISRHWNKLEDKINSIMSDRGSSPEVCTTYMLETSELFKPISTLHKNIGTINGKLQSVPIATVKKFASKVEKKIDFDTSALINTFEKTQSVANSLVSEIDDAKASIKIQVGHFCRHGNEIRIEIDKLVLKTQELSDIKNKLQGYLNQVYANLDSDVLASIENNITSAITILENSNFTFSAMSEEEKNKLEVLASLQARSIIEGTEVNGASIATLKSDLDDLLKKIPQPTANELRHMVVTKILNTEPVENIRIAMNDALSPVMDEVRDVVVDLFSSVNQVIYDVFDKLSSQANKALAEATSAVKAMPIKSGKMDGYALISGDELNRLHVGAEWEVDSGDEDTSYSFNGALDMERWGAGGKAGCGGGTSTDGNMDVKISTRDIDLTLGGKELSIDELYFGFTLQDAIPVGIMGGIASNAGFDFNKFKLYDMKLLVGIGAIETYLGAKSAAIFDVYQMNAAFLLGKTCGKEIITALDPEVAEFITLPNNVFKGAYIRGGASFPIWDNGCTLRVGVTADLGAWVLIPGTYGGLVGGGAYGRALCIAALKGKVQALFQKSGDNIKFQGKGWGAAGVGWCSPSKWYSVAKSRRDDYCGTGDAQFGAEYDNGWELLDIDTDATF